MKKLINSYKDGALITRSDILFSVQKYYRSTNSVAAANSVFSKFEKVAKEN